MRRTAIFCAEPTPPWQLSRLRAGRSASSSSRACRILERRRCQCTGCSPKRSGFAFATAQRQRWSWVMGRSKAVHGATRSRQLHLVSPRSFLRTGRHQCVFVLHTSLTSRSAMRRCRISRLLRSRSSSQKLRASLSAHPGRGSRVVLQTPRRNHEYPELSHRDPRRCGRHGSDRMRVRYGSGNGGQLAEDS